MSVSVPRVHDCPLPLNFTLPDFTKLLSASADTSYIGLKFGLYNKDPLTASSGKIQDCGHIALCALKIFKVYGASRWLSWLRPISKFMKLSPMLGSVLPAQSLEPALESVSLSPCPSPAHIVSKIFLKIFNKNI